MRGLRRARLWAAFIALSVIGTLLVPASQPAGAVVTGPTYVQGASRWYSSGVTAATVALTSNVALDDLIVVTGYFTDPTGTMTMTCADSQNNTYTSVASVRYGGNGTLVTCYAYASQAAALTATVTYSTTTGKAGILVTELAGVAASSPVDSYTTVGSYTTANNLMSTPSKTPTADGEYIYAAFFGGTNFTAGNGFTLETNTAFIMTESMIQDAATPVVATATATTDSNYMGNMLLIKPSGYQRVQVSATIDPTFTFTVSGLATACGGTSQTGTATGTSVNFGHLGTNTASTAAQNIVVQTNAGGGSAIYIRYSGALSDGNGHTIADMPGDGYWANALAFPSSGTAAFGYRYDWYGAGLWNAFKTTNMGNLSFSSPGTGTRCIEYQAQTSATTAAGSYSTTVIYTAVPTF